VTAAQRVLLSIDISTCRVRSSKPTVHRCCCQSVDRQTLNRFMTLTAYYVQSNSSMHRNECIALCKNISLQRGRFCTRSLASCIPRSSKDRSCSSSRLWAATPVVFSTPILWRRFKDGLAYYVYCVIQYIRVRRG